MLTLVQIRMSEYTMDLASEELSCVPRRSGRQEDIQKFGWLEALLRLLIKLWLSAREWCTTQEWQSSLFMTECKKFKHHAGVAVMVSLLMSLELKIIV